MSFVLSDLHEQQLHAHYLVYQFQHGPTVCMACFLHSLADPAHLESKKIFVIREFIGWFGPDGPEGPRPLHDILSQHAQLLVSGLLTACTCTQDLGLSQHVIRLQVGKPAERLAALLWGCLLLAKALQDAALLTCSYAYNFMPEMFTKRVLELLLELSWPATAAALDLTSTQTATLQSTAAVGSCLALLQQLVRAYSCAAQFVTAALHHSEDLVTAMSSGLTCGIEAIVVPLLHVFSVLARPSQAAVAAAGSQGAPAGLPSKLVQQLFDGLLQLLPDLLSTEMKEMVLQLLLGLFDTGCVIESSLPSPTAAAAVAVTLHSSQAVYVFSQSQPMSQQQSSFATALMAATKPILLDTNPQLQLLGCDLLAAVAERAPAALLQQLIESDCCEHLFEVLRGTLSNCNMRMQLSAAALEEQRRGLAGNRLAAAAAGVVGAAEVAAESLQAAATAGLHCLANQGPAFAQHFHFGIDTLTELLLHCTRTCNTPTLAAALMLLAGATDPSNPRSLLVPVAAVLRLAAAAVGVLPDAEHAAAAGSGGREQQQQQGMELQPGPELQTAYESACRLLTNLAVKWGSSDSSNWGMLQPHILAGTRKALAALSLLSRRSLAEGFLVAACRLATTTVQILTHFRATHADTAQQQQQQQCKQGHSHSTSVAPGGGGTMRQQKKQQQQQQQQKGKQNSRKQYTGHAADEKPFARRRQQQQQRMLGGANAAPGAGSAASSATVAAPAEDEVLLLLLETALQLALPAALGVLKAAADQVQANTAAAVAQQQELAAFVNILGAVVQLLLALLSCGSSSTQLASYLPSFARQLLSPPNFLASAMWDMLQAVQLPAAAAADVWHMLLAAAVLLEGDSFMSGSSRAHLATLAASLSSKCSSSRLALLELLYGPGPAAIEDQQQQQYARGGSSSSGSSATADIRRFCGVSELHRAAICIAAAVLRCTDVCWAWSDVLAALDAAVGNAGPGVVSQPELLTQIVLLYCQAEQQLADELAHQAAQQGTAMLADVLQQQQQQGFWVDSALPAAAAVAVQQLPVPGHILHALEKVGQNMPAHLSPDHGAVQWVLARAVHLPGAVQLLLQRWLGELLPTSAAAAAVEVAVTADQQQQGCVALASVLRNHPAALQQALLVAGSSFESRQLLQAAAWLCVFIAVLNQSSISSRDNSTDYLFQIGQLSLSGSSSSNGGSSAGGLHQLLLGDSGLLTLCRKCMLAASNSVCSSWSSCYIVVCCNNFLLSAVLAVSAAAAGREHDYGNAPAGTQLDVVLQQQQQLDLQLLQQGIQQVHMAATCVLQLQFNHPLQLQLCMSTANAANALLHTGIVQQQDVGLLQLLTGFYEINQLMGKLAAAAISGSSISNGGNLQAQQQQQQLPAQTASERELEQLIALVCSQHGYSTTTTSSSSSSSSSSVICSTGDSNSLGGTAAAAASAAVVRLGPVTPACQLAAALQWQQHQQLLEISRLHQGRFAVQQHQHADSSNGQPAHHGHNTLADLHNDLACRPLGIQPQRQHTDAAAAAAEAHTEVVQEHVMEGPPVQQMVYGLSAAHMLLLAQGQGNSILQLLLLDSVRLLLLHQAANMHYGSSSNALWQQQQWAQLLAVLQNMAAAASNSSSIYKEATVSCLAALFTAAAAAHVTRAAAAAHVTRAAAAAPNGGLHMIARSPWTTEVIRVVLDRLCRQTVTLRMHAQPAEQAAADWGHVTNSVSNTSAATAARICGWLLNAEVQQQCHAWCADVDWLLRCIDIACEAAAAVAKEAAPGSSSSKQGGLGSAVSDEVQLLLLPAVEQQHLVQFLCWAAAKREVLTALFDNGSRRGGIATSAAGREQQWQEQQFGQEDVWRDQNVYSQQQHWWDQQMVCGVPPPEKQQQQQLRPDTLLLPPPTAAACLLQFCMSRLSLQLLAALLQIGCCANQLPWLQQQLQQQMWSVLQKQGRGPGVSSSTAAAAAAAGPAYGMQQVLCACGGVQVLSGLEVIDGAAIGLLRPCVVQLLTRDDGAHALNCYELLEAVVAQQQQQQQ